MVKSSKRNEHSRLPLSSAQRRACRCRACFVEHSQWLPVPAHALTTLCHPSLAKGHFSPGALGSWNLLLDVRARWQGTVDGYRQVSRADETRLACVGTIEWGLVLGLAVGRRRGTVLVYRKDKACVHVGLSGLSGRGPSACTLSPWLGRHTSPQRECTARPLSVSPDWLAANRQPCIAHRGWDRAAAQSLLSPWPRPGRPTTCPNNASLSICAPSCQALQPPLAPLQPQPADPACIADTGFVFHTRAAIAEQFRRPRHCL